MFRVSAKFKTKDALARDVERRMKWGDFDEELDGNTHGEELVVNGHESEAARVLGARRRALPNCLNPEQRARTRSIHQTPATHTTHARKRPHNDDGLSPLAVKQSKKISPPASTEEATNNHPKYAKRTARKAGEREQRRTVREAAQAASGDSHKAIAKKKALETIQRAAVVEVNLADRVCETGWTGLPQPIPRKTYTLEEAKNEGLEVMEWDGTETIALVNSEDDKVLGILGKIRIDPDQLAAGAAAVEGARHVIVFTKKEKSNPRGTSPASAFGISHGGGQKQPMNLSHSVKTNEVLEDLLRQPLFEQASLDANYWLEFYAPRAHHYQQTTLKTLEAHDRTLKRNYNDTIFAACTWNFGPQFASYAHLDSNNYAHTWCAITAFGDYNPKHGGHLILWDLGIIIEFPPGATILIPSALLLHSNTLVQSGETRYSFVQYSAGALARWIEQGFQSRSGARGFRI
ncbi:hypothetical protein PM082_018367 [Marasmius tenuissimus]|nr:hypothetical protein PM082_018367 [Marasmius tenuissimus]